MLRLLKRVFEIDVEHCPNCGGELKIIAAILRGEPEHGKGEGASDSPILILWAGSLFKRSSRSCYTAWISSGQGKVRRHRDKLWRLGGGLVL